MKALVGFLIAIALLSSASFAEASKSSCLDKYDVQEIEQEFEWDVTSKKYADWELCDSSDLTYKVLQGMLFLKKLQFKTSKSDPTNTNILGASPYAFFRERVKRIVFESNEHPYCVPVKKNGVVVWAMYGFAEANDKSMHICENADSLSTLSMLQFFVHEARHQDGQEFNHVFCEQGHFSETRKYDCDKTFEQTGAYAIGVEFNRKISRSSSVNPVLQQTARNQSIVDLFNRFNRLPLGITSGALLQDRSGSLSFYNGDSWTFIRKEDPASRLVRHWEWPFLYTNTFPYLKLLVPGDRPASPSRTMKYEMMLQSVLKAATISEIIDVFHGAFYSCYLTEQRLLCKTLTSRLYELPLKTIKPLRLFSTSIQSVASADQAFILSDDGTLYEIPADVSTLEKLNEKSLQSRPAPLEAVRIDNWKGNPEHWIQLTLSGTVGFAHAKQKKFLPIPLFQDKKFKDMYSPFYYSPRLRDL